MSPFTFAFFSEISTIQTIAIVIGLIATVSVLSGVIGKVLMTRAREQTRREIAAYVAEGTIDPDKGIEMMRACRSADEAYGDLYAAKADAKAAKAAVKAEKKAANFA
jgi:hypothetical protein